jgi:hypothetical protein
VVGSGLSRVGPSRGQAFLTDLTSRGGLSDACHVRSSSARYPWQDPSESDTKWLRSLNECTLRYTGETGWVIKSIEGEHHSKETQNWSSPSGCRLLICHRCVRYTAAGRCNRAQPQSMHPSSHCRIAGDYCRRLLPQDPCAVVVQDAESHAVCDSKPVARFMTRIETSSTGRKLAYLSASDLTCTNMDVQVVVSLPRSHTRDQVDWHQARQQPLRSAKRCGARPDANFRLSKPRL